MNGNTDELVIGLTAKEWVRVKRDRTRLAALESAAKGVTNSVKRNLMGNAIVDWAAIEQLAKALDKIPPDIEV